MSLVEPQGVVEAVPEDEMSRIADDGSDYSQDEEGEGEEDGEDGEEEDVEAEEDFSEDEDYEG